MYVHSFLQVTFTLQKERIRHVNIICNAKGCRFLHKLHIHTDGLRDQLCSFDVLRAVCRLQFRTSSQDTLQRQAMLSSCFTCVRSAFSSSNRLSSKPVFVDVDGWVISVHVSMFIYTSGALLSSLYM